MKFCAKCGKEIQDEAVVCVHCGVATGKSGASGETSPKSKIAAGLLNILLPFGIGRFYMGDAKTGVFQLLVTILTCGIGSLWPFIDGIMILVGKDVRDGEGRIME